MKDPIIDEILKKSPPYIKTYVDQYAKLIIKINSLINNSNKHKPMVKIYLNNQFDFTLLSIAKLSHDLSHNLIDINP